MTTATTSKSGVAWHKVFLPFQGSFPECEKELIGGLGQALEQESDYRLLQTYARPGANDAEGKDVERS